MTDYSKAAEAETFTPDTEGLVVIPSKGHTPEVEIIFQEFQSLCPLSGRHDQGNLSINYKPDGSILEGKSVRDYLSSWRNMRNWQEYITEEIAQVLFDACQAEWITVDIRWSPRGGLYVNTFSRRDRDPEKKE